MPWHTAESADCPSDEPWAVIKDADDSVVACHPSKAAAQKHLAALYANEPGASHMASQRPPRDNIVRAIFPGPEMRLASSPDDMPTMHGEFAVFNRWTKIDSKSEGRFLERIAPGAFAKTFAERTPKVLFQHGKDPQVGDKPLGVPTVLQETRTGAYYEVPLLATSYNRDLAPGLAAGAYGASFRFSVVKEHYKRDAERSVDNPEGLPERTIQEAALYEFGPVTFPAYIEATAGIRSLTDEYLFDRLTADPDRLRELVTYALPDGAGTESHSSSSSRVYEISVTEAAPTRTIITPKENRTVDIVHPADRPARIDELKESLAKIERDYSGVLPEDVQARWGDVDAELTALLDAQEADEKRRDQLAAQEARIKAITGTTAAPIGEDERTQAPPKKTYEPPAIKVEGRVRDIYNLQEIRNAARSPEDEKALLRDSALRAIEAARFPHMDRAIGQGRVAGVMRDTEEEDVQGYVPTRILLTGRPAYRRALVKTLTGQMLTNEETQAYTDFQANERAMGQVTGSAGGFGVTFDLDPTMVQTSSGAIVPYRRACRVVTTTTNEWRGVTSGGVVASYAAEAAVGTDNSPTLAQPAALVQKAHCFVPFSMELQGDYSGLEAELAREIQDAKDVLEAVQFSTGAGTTVFPQGIVTGATTAFNLATTGVLAAADLYGCEITLAARFRVRAAWFANRMFYNKIRQIDTAGGAQLWTENLRVGLDRNDTGNTGYDLLGYPANEASGFTTTFTGAGNKVAVFGDPNYYVVVDRIGLNLELVPILTQQATAGTGFGIPTGQRGVYAWWRNTAKVLSASAFLTVTTI